MSGVPRASGQMVLVAMVRRDCDTKRALVSPVMVEAEGRRRQMKKKPGKKKGGELGEPTWTHRASSQATAPMESQTG